MGTWSWGDGEGLGVRGGSGVVEGFWGRGEVPGEAMGVRELCRQGRVVLLGCILPPSPKTASCRAGPGR